LQVRLSRRKPEGFVHYDRVRKHWPDSPNFFPRILDRDHQRPSNMRLVINRPQPVTVAEGGTVCARPSPDIVRRRSRIVLTSYYSRFRTVQPTAGVSRTTTRRRPLDRRPNHVFHHGNDINASHRPRFCRSAARGQRPDLPSIQSRPTAPADQPSSASRKHSGNRSLTLSSDRSSAPGHSPASGSRIPRTRSMRRPGSRTTMAAYVPGCSLGANNCLPFTDADFLDSHIVHRGHFDAGASNLGRSHAPNRHLRA